MAQTKTIQLLRSSSVYTSADNARTEVGKLAGQDGEIRIARYNAAADGETAKIQSMLCVYHATPNLPTGSGNGWTFIEDVSNNADSPAALKELIESVIGGVGLEDDGSYTGYSDDAVAGTTKTLDATVDAIIDYIKQSNKAASVENGKVVTTVTQSNGRVTETKENLTDIVMAGYAADTTKTGAIAATDTLEQAFNKLENGIASATVKSTDKTVKITDNSGKDLSVNIDGTTLVKNTTSGVISSDLKILKETTGLDTNVKEQYKLVYGTSTTAIGDVIKVYKDSSLKSVALNGQNLDFTYILADGTESTVSVDVSTFLAESEFKDGLQVNNGEVSVKVGDGIEYGSEASGNKSIKVKIDTTSSDAENFLSVGANGVKISGVQDAIDTAIGALDVTTDAAVAGQYVAAIEQTDGVVAVKTRANVADAVLTGYDKGPSAPQSTAVAATDDVKTAISKLEWQVAAANAGVEALDATVNSTGGTNVAVQVVEEDGVITAVNITTDSTINSTDLNNKIATLDADLNASGTAEHGGTFVMSGVTEVDGVITSVDSVEVEAAGAAATAKATIDNYTVNNKKISTNPVLGGSDVALTGYAKGSDATAVSASDSVNVAIGKLENQVDAAKAAARDAHSEVVNANGNTHVTVSASQPDSTTGKVTYTVNETNIANANDLTAEIAARKAVDGQSGDTYTANTGTNYISDATSLNNADVQLDTALKAADDAMLTQINGSNAIEVSTKASKQQTVSLKLDTTTTTGNITSDMLQITSNGLMMKDTWDCGVF